MTKCFYCNEEAYSCVRYIGKWLCVKHDGIFMELKFKLEREEQEEKNKKILIAFEKLLGQEKK